VTDPTTRWCLIYGLMHSHEPSTGRRNLSIAAVGWFDGREFHKEFEQELDFGTDNYAFQAFVDGDTAIGIGWLGNWADTGPAIDFPTAMTLPRKLVLAGSALLTPPIGPVESLRSHILDRTRLAHGDQVSLSSSAVEIQFELSAPGSQFELELGHPGVRLSVRQDEHGLAIGHEVEGAVASPHYIARGAKASRFRVFLDFGSIEVFADNGRWVGTKRLNGFAPMTSARLAAAPGVISHATLWALKL
jgi:beta-fructofuranosidase